MNPARLLQHFDRISEAPDAIPRLRRFILDLAVRGKLVDQDPNDEPASELLKRIEMEKARLVKEGKIRKTEPLPKIPEDQSPFLLPGNWILVRLGEVITLLSGQHLQPNEYSENNQSGPPYVTGPADFGMTGLAISRYALVRKAVATKGQLLLTVKGAGVGKTATCDIPEVAISRQLMALTAIRWSQHFLTLTTHLLAETLKEKARSLIPGISRDDVELFVFGLPPLPEQHRIVAKVDELMALCDQLEAAKTEREQSRDRLVAASLHRLNSPANVEEANAPDAFRDHTRFYFNHLPRLTIRPDHIKQLRQTILNLAVRGKLVAQDPNDEPVMELLNRIQAEKARLVKIGKIQKNRPLPDIGDFDLLFDLPIGWSWVRLGVLSRLVTSGSRDWAKFYSVDGATFVRMGNLSRGSYQLRLNNIQRVNPPSDSEGARTKLEEGDILISITGEVGLLGLIPPTFGDAYINQHTCLVRPMDELKNRYLPELFRSPFAQNQFNEPQRGLKNSFRLTDVTGILVPLPPLPEQHRIVAKVDELMAICDQLEAQLTATEADNRCLLEAVLHEALAPTLEEAA